MPCVIKLSNIARLYESGATTVRALDGVDLSIERGEMVAIMGSSGSGKSTLMNILGCLDRPTSGSYLLDGVDTGSLSEADIAHIRGSRVGFVFQNFNLLPRTTALENVSLPLFYVRTGAASSAERIKRARVVLQSLGLEGRESNTPAQLSGGQQQRVAIARALVNKPSILLADEPTGNLDSVNSREIMETLRQLNCRDGVTVIVVTHDPTVAAFADRVITMRDGRIIDDAIRKSSSDGMRMPAQVIQAVIPREHQLHPILGFLTMTLATAAHALMRNKTRSALTMLGVFIGVAALIAMVAVGQGANEAVRRQIETLGTNLLVIVPGTTTSSGARAGSGSASTLTTSDAQAIRRDAQSVRSVSYAIRQAGQVISGNENWTTGIQGVTSSYIEATNWKIAEGRGLTPDDDRDAAMVCLLGQTVFRQLFPLGDNPVGVTVLIKGRPMRIVGVLAGKGQSTMGQDQDDLVMIPFSSAETKVLGVAAPTQTVSAFAATYPPALNPLGLLPRLTGRVNSIYVQASDSRAVPVALREVTEILTRRHHIRPGAPNDFAVRNLSQVAATAEGSSRVMALLLAIVASISLLVGGIGIMNILLVSVTERTREIGLRMAVGARRIHVLLQFLVEAVFLSVIGGSAGIVSGIAFSKLISAVAKWPTLLSPTAIIGGFLFSAMVGICFGFPSTKSGSTRPD